MIQVIKDKIATLFRSAGEEYRKTPIQFLGAVGALIALLTHVILNLYTKVAFLDRITQRFDIKIETNLPALGVTACLLLWSFIHLKQQRKSENDYEFINYSGVSWKINNPKSKDFTVDFPSYCIEHKVQHFENPYLYNCPACGRNKVSHIEQHQMYPLYEAVQNLVRARNDKHIKI